jgi:hypothetical protein
MTIIRIFLAALAAAMTFSGQAQAQSSPSSTYERFAFETCPIFEETERSTTRRCTMQKGPSLVLYHHEHGVDTYLEPAYSDGNYEADGYFRKSMSGHFGDLAVDKSGRTTLEWRVDLVNGEWRPFALIYRTTYGFDDKPQARLEIVAFGFDYTCQVAVVEVSVQNHNAEARAIADAAKGAEVCEAGAAEWAENRMGSGDNYTEAAERESGDLAIEYLEFAIAAYEGALGFYARQGLSAEQASVQTLIDAVRTKLQQLRQQ